MDTASGVHVVRRIRVETGTVRMACYQVEIVLDGIVGQKLFYAVFLRIISGGACGIQNAEAFQRLPEVTYQKTGLLPADGIEEVSLMAVGQVQTDAGAGIFQDDALVEGQRREKGLFTLAFRTEIGTADPVRVAGFLFLQIMISIDKIESVLPVEKRQQPEYVVVDFDNPAHLAVFPQFIAVSQFDVSIPLRIIMLQSGKIQVLVFEEVIVGAAVSPMAVADDTETAAGRQREDRGIMKGFVETGFAAHAGKTPFRCFSILRRRKGSSS